MTLAWMLWEKGVKLLMNKKMQNIDNVFCTPELKTQYDYPRKIARKKLFNCVPELKLSNS